MDWDAYVRDNWPLTYAVYGVFSDPSFWILSIGEEYWSWHPNENFPTPEFIARMDYLEDSFVNIAPKKTPARWRHADEFPFITKYFSVRESYSKTILNLHHDIHIHNGYKFEEYMAILKDIEHNLEIVERAQRTREEIRAQLPMPIARRVAKWLYPL